MINWSAGPYFIKTEIDPSGGTSYFITATSQLLSVPYAMYAEKTNCSSCDNQFINANGDDTMNGTLTVDQIDYTTPRVHYAFVGEADFVARSPSDNVQRSTGNGGAFITTTSSTLGMIGRLHIPVGASITNVEIAMFDNSATEDLYIDLRQHFFTGAYNLIGSVTSSGNSGFSTLTLSTGLPFTVDSSGVYEFMIYAKNGASVANWPGSSLVIRNIKVTYTLSSAQ